MHSIVLRRTQLPAFLGLSLATIDRLRAAGNFPGAVRLGAHAVGFLRTDIEAWLTARREAAQ